MAKSCFDCGADVKKWGGKDAMYFPEDKLKTGLMEMDISDSKVSQMQENDILCEKCGKKVYCRHAVDVYNFYQTKLMPDEFEELMRSGEDWIPIAKAELEVTQSSVEEPSMTNTEPIPTNTVNKASAKMTTMDDLTRLTKTRHDKTKDQWNKNGVIQFKDENIAILQRMWGSQVQFIIACSQITSEGYRLMAIDEGKTGGQASGGFTGGVNAYFYFQKADYIR